MATPKKLLSGLSLSFGLAFVITAFGAGVLEARTTRVVSYTFSKVWPSALRFLRIDEGLKITEKDKEAGYILFELAEEGRVFTGSMELVPTRDSVNRKSVRASVRINDRPSHMELGVVERFRDKLKEEWGEPAPPPPPKIAKPKKDQDKSKKKKQS